jgi:hypothetical protein
MKEISKAILANFEYRLYDALSASMVAVPEDVYTDIIRELKSLSPAIHHRRHITLAPSVNATRVDIRTMEEVEYEFSYTNIPHIITLN